MCGFIIIIGLDGQPIPTQALARGSARIAHRGPDDDTILCRDNVGVAFRRLSINDLYGGSQPFWNSEHNCGLVCNGEIYNSSDLRVELGAHGHQFKTGSDCEVILPLYRDDPGDFISKLEGMFAFGIFDFANKRLVFGRDRFGIKPLYYYQDSNWLVVASEIKSILATGLVERQLDSRYVYDCFTFGYAIDQKTMVSGISTLPPAYIATIDFMNPHDMRLREYWQPQFLGHQGFRGFGGQARTRNRIRQRFSDAVGSHMVSDAPIGAYLSGGLDSTVTSILMKKFSSQLVATFSIGFTEPDFDESRNFNKTIAAANFDGTTIVAGPDDISQFGDAVTAIEMIQFSPMDIPLIRLSKAVRDRGIKVVLCGEGADELFGGYAVFPWIHISSALKLSAASLLKDRLSTLALRYIGINDLMHSVFKFVFSDECQRIENELGFCPPWLPIWKSRHEHCHKLFNEPEKLMIDNHPALLDFGQKLRNRYSGLDRFNQGLYVDLKTRLPNYILQRTDRTSMINSVEARVPFLDRQFAECALGCSPLLKSYGFREKAVLRDAFKSVVPHHLKSVRKYGYVAPNQWFWTKQGAELVDRTLNPAALSQTGLFNSKEVARRVANVRSVGDPAQWNLNHHHDAAFLTGIMSTQILIDSLQDP